MSLKLAVYIPWEQETIQKVQVFPGATINQNLSFVCSAKMADKNLHSK